MSRLREILRGENKGTIGKGVGEAIAMPCGNPDFAIRAGEFRSPKNILTQKIEAIRQDKLHQARSLLGAFGATIPEEAYMELAVLENEELVSTTADSMNYLSNLVRIVGRNYLDTILEKDGVIITETSHGALLHPWYGFIPHTTQVDPTSQDVLRTVKEHNYSGTIIRIGVSRSYMTRHGAGRL
jgi:adenylosuccinate synthase